MSGHIGFGILGSSANNSWTAVYIYGTPLSCAHFVTAFQQALQMAGFHTSPYSSHRFRIGAAMTAAEVGLSDSLIKMFGRWKSVAYAMYIRSLRECLMSVPLVFIRS